MITPEEHKRDRERYDSLLRDKAQMEGALAEWNKRLEEVGAKSPAEARSLREDILTRKGEAEEKYRELAAELDGLERKRDLG